MLADVCLQDAVLNPPPPLKDEILVDRLASIPVRSRYEALKKEAADLEGQIKQLHDALETLLRIQQRYVFLTFTGNMRRSSEQHWKEMELTLTVCTRIAS
jgi:hypothetical protein